MASLLDVLIFDAVYGSWILSLPLFTLDISYSYNVTIVVTILTWLLLRQLLLVTSY